MHGAKRKDKRRPRPGHAVGRSGSLHFFLGWVTLDEVIDWFKQRQIDAAEATYARKESDLKSQEQYMKRFDESRSCTWLDDEMPE